MACRDRGGGSLMTSPDLQLALAAARWHYSRCQVSEAKQAEKRALQMMRVALPTTGRDLWPTPSKGSEGSRGKGLTLKVPPLKVRL